MNTHTNKRIIFSTFLGSVLFGAVIYKAFVLQVRDRQKLIQYSNDQTLRESVIYPFRSSIVDRNGEPLAINIQTYNIFTLPKNLKNPKLAMKKLSKIVPSFSRRKLLKMIKNRSRFTFLARKMELSHEQYKQIGNLSGIYIEKTIKRYYPNNQLLSQVLGYVGMDNKGLSGVEYKFDSFLRGQPQKVKYFIDAKGRPIKFENEIKSRDSGTLKLTIDKNLQAHVESFLEEAVIEHKALGGGVGVLDANTGEVLAVANYPTVNLNKISKASLRNAKLSFVSAPIEPGSTFKIFTVASALENNIVRPDTHYYCEKGKFLVGDHTISEANPNKGYGWLSVTDIIRLSSNIGTTKIAFDLSFPKLDLTLKKLRMGKKTGIELPGESRGIYRARSNVSPLSLSNLSFGQGIATTGIQMISAYAAFANGGFYIRPTLIKGSLSNHIQYPESYKERVFSQDQVDQINKMLLLAVEKGTGTNAKIPFVKIAGKTSTAQRVNSKGVYENYISGFIGHPLDVEDPFVVYVYIDSPKGKKYYGGDVAAPVFKKIVEIMLSKRNSLNVAEGQMLHNEIEEHKEIVDKVKKVSSSTSPAKIGDLPSFIGLDKKSARNMAQDLELKLVLNGAGLVYKQAISQKNKKNTILTLFLRPPEHE